MNRDAICTSEIHDRLDTVSLLCTDVLEKLDNKDLDKARENVEDLVLRLESVISDLWNKTVIDDMIRDDDGVVVKTSMYEPFLSFDQMNLLQEMLLKKMTENQERIEYLEYRNRFLFEDKNFTKFTEEELNKFEKEINEELLEKKLYRDFLNRLHYSLMNAPHTNIKGETHGNNNR